MHTGTGTHEAAPRRRWATLREHRWYSRGVELARFGSVGAGAFVIDVGLFNLLRYGPGTVLGDKPLTAKIVSVAVATLAAWLGNRLWTFGDRRTSSRGKELISYALVNVAGMLVAVACLWTSHYILGLRTPFADNVSANGVGLVLATAFRYIGYRRWVFSAGPETRATA